MIDVWELMRWLMDGVEVMAVLIKVRVSINFLCLRSCVSPRRGGSQNYGVAYFVNEGSPLSDWLRRQADNVGIAALGHSRRGPRDFQLSRLNHFSSRH
jgi:hypothetical protein